MKVNDFEIFQLVFIIKIDGTSFVEESNNDGRIFRNVQIYTGDKWYHPADGNIKNLKFETII